MQYACWHEFTTYSLPTYYIFITFILSVQILDLFNNKTHMQL